MKSSTLIGAWKCLLFPPALFKNYDKITYQPTYHNSCQQSSCNRTWKHQSLGSKRQAGWCSLCSRHWPKDNWVLWAAFQHIISSCQTWHGCDSWFSSMSLKILSYKICMPSFNQHHLFQDYFKFLKYTHCIHNYL